MTEPELKQLLTAIIPPSETARAAAHAHWASLAKPLGGLHMPTGPAWPSRWAGWAHWRPCWKMPPP